jgi:transcriptional antiterminator/mannitol/fructose-specific phosphotransferase system IIA component (Ntr-type)
MKPQTLHRRQRRLLTLLRAQQKIVTSKELAAQMEVSDRTIRNDVQVLNKVLAACDARIETIRGKGLILRAADPKSAMLNQLAYAESSLQTKEDRAQFLLVELLLADDGIQADSLEDEMFISRTTLETDIRFIQKTIANRRPHLYIRRKGNSIRVDAPEWRRRAVLTKIFAESWDYHSREGVLLQDSLLDEEVFQIIFARTKAAVRRFSIKMDDYDLVALAFTIAVAEFRIRTGHPLDEPVPVTDGALKTAHIVDALLDELEGTLPTHFDGDERRSIMLSLSFRILPFQEAQVAESPTYPLDENALRATELFLSAMKREYGVDFTGDHQLYMDLACRIFRLEKRLRYSYERKNLLLPTIKTRYIFFFELAMTIRECFQEVYHMDLGEDEWGYFSDRLIVSVDRAAKQRYPVGIPVAFVSHLGRSDREMLVSQIRALYGNAICLFGPFSIYEREKIQAVKPELIISTVRLETVRSELAHIPHITVALAPNDEFYLRLNRHIRAIHEKIFFRELPQPPERYFSSELFITNLDASSRREVITKLTRLLIGRGYANNSCTARALEREEWSSTAREDGIAMPRVRMLGHPAETVVVTALLRKPITWAGQKVRMVFFVAVSEEDLPLFGTLLNYLSNDLCQKPKRNKLFQITSYQDLLELL